MGEAIKYDHYEWTISLMFTNFLDVNVNKTCRFSFDLVTICYI